MAIYGFNTVTISPAANDVETLYSSFATFPAVAMAVPTPRAGFAASLRAEASMNTLNAATIIDLLADGVLVAGTTLTIPASTNGSFGPVAGSFPIAAGAVLSFRIRNGAGAGTAGLTGSIEWRPS